MLPGLILTQWRLLSQDVTERTMWKKHDGKRKRNGKKKREKLEEKAVSRVKESLGEWRFSSARQSVGSIPGGCLNKNNVPLYFWEGIMLSMASPFSSFFSISTMSLTPSTTIWT